MHINFALGCLLSFESIIGPGIKNQASGRIHTSQCLSEWLAPYEDLACHRLSAPPPSVFGRNIENYMRCKNLDAISNKYLCRFCGFEEQSELNCKLQTSTRRREHYRGCSLTVQTLRASDTKPDIEERVQELAASTHTHFYLSSVKAPLISPINCYCRFIYPR